jgi:hypothetical protein
MDISKLNRRHRRAAARYIRKESAKYTDVWAEIPKKDWPDISSDPAPIAVFRNRWFLVQVFEEKGGIHRLSINRTEISKGGQWAQDIRWEELQRIKDTLGYRNFDAVEVFPRERDVVNVANMRHLFVLPLPLHYAWRRE